LIIPPVEAYQKNAKVHFFRNSNIADEYFL
jgi:hypothetical protein